MAGEHVLIVDDSVAECSVAQRALENAGYRVSVASNGAAAVLSPENETYDLIVIDSRMEGVGGLKATREMRADPERFQTPVLLLVPESEVDGRQSPETGGASGYLVKPYDPVALTHKARALLDEKEILEQCRVHLREAADRHIEQLTESYVQEAVEKRTQLLIERAVQSVISQVEQRAKREVDQKVTALTAEKEQELVRMTVHEVARSMVEKLAERKVTDVMEEILKDSTEKAVRRSAESMLPGMIRDRLRDTLENTLPREVNMRVREQAEQLVPGISEKIIEMVNGVSEKVIPRLAREKLPELSKAHVEEYVRKTVPRMVEALCHREVDRRMAERVGPMVSKASKRFRRLAFSLFFTMLLIVAGFAGGMIYYTHTTRAEANPVEESVILSILQKLATGEEDAGPESDNAP